MPMRAYIHINYNTVKGGREKMKYFMFIRAYIGERRLTTTTTLFPDDVRLKGCTRAE